MNKLKPREYQLLAKQNFSLIVNDKSKQGKKYIIQLPTGAGKTFVFELLTETAPNDNFLMLVPRINLANQTIEGKEWGLLQGNKSIKPNARIMIATLQTFLNRLKQGRFSYDTYKYIVVDECHLLATNKEGKSMGDLIEKATRLGVTVVGFSATPYDSKGSELKIWEGATHLIPKKWRDINRFIKEGYLTPLIYKTLGTIDKSKLVRGKEDYTESSTVEAMQDSPIDVVQTTLEHRLGATLIIAVNIDHAEALKRDFASRGCSVAVLHSKLSKNNTILNDFSLGKIDFLISVGMIGTGTDLPIARTLVLARPRGSQSLFRQEVGRVLRLHKWKPYALVLDLYDSIGLCGGHPLLPPPTTGDKEVKAKGICCKECQSQTPLTITKIDINFDEYEQTTHKKCGSCGGETVTVKQVGAVTCQECMHTQILKFVFSLNGWAVTKCDNCEKEIQLNELTPKELIVTPQGRDEAISNIITLAKERLAGEELERFSRVFDTFSVYAELDYLSAVLDFFGNFKKNYSDKSMALVLERMEKKTLTYQSRTDKTVIHNTMKTLGFINYEYIEFLKEDVASRKDLEPVKTFKAVSTRLCAWSRKGEKLEDTKKLKTLTKKFLTYLQKQHKGE